MTLVMRGGQLLMAGTQLTTNEDCCCADEFPPCTFCTTTSDSFPYTKVVVTITEDPDSLSPFRCEDGTSFAGVYEFLTACNLAGPPPFNSVGVTLTCEDESCQISIAWNIFTAPPSTSPGGGFSSSGYFGISASCSEGIFNLQKDLRCSLLTETFSFPSTFGLIFHVQIIP